LVADLVVQVSTWNIGEMLWMKQNAGPSLGIEYKICAKMRQTALVYCWNALKNDYTSVKYNGVYLRALDHKNNGKITNKMHIKFYVSILW
jgi:hypothetical protein